MVTDVLELIKRMYSGNIVVPGVKEVLVKTFGRGNLGNRLRGEGFDLQNLPDDQVPALIDRALELDRNGLADYFLEDLFTKTAQEDLDNMPITFIDSVLDYGHDDMTMATMETAVNRILHRHGVENFSETEAEFFADLNENAPENAEEKAEYTRSAMQTHYDQLMVEHRELGHVIQVYRDSMVDEMLNRTRVQTQEKEILALPDLRGQVLGIEDHTAQRQATPEELMEVSRRQMERERAQVTEQTANEQVAEPKVEIPLERNPLLLSLCKTFEKNDETSLYMADTVMLALGFASSEVALVGQHGVQDVAGLIGEKVKHEDLNDAQLINGLFNLEQEHLDQMPISFYADLVKCPAFSYADKDKQNQIFGKILKTIGIENFDNLDKIEPDKVAYSHKAIKDIFGAYFAINAKDKNQEDELNQFLNSTINEKLQQVLDNATELNADPEQRNNLLNLVDKHKGDYYKAADEVLGMFNDTKALQDEQLNSVALGSSGEYYYPVSNAKTVLAEYKLGAYAEASKALGIINEKNAENITLINPKDKDKHEAQFITMAKNTMANFAKPQNIAKIATRTIATQAITRGISHLVGGAVPGVGAAVCLAMKLGECGKRIFKDKESPKEVFAQSAADLARGAITVGLSFTPVMPIAGPIAAVAATAIRGMQAAHKEGLKVGKDFFKRVAKEFTKKSNLINLGLSTAGAAIGIGARAGLQHYHDMKAAAELDDQSIDAISGIAPQAEEVVQPQSGYEQYQAEQLEDYQQHLHDQHDAMVFPQNDGTDATIPDGQNTISSHEISTQEIPNDEIPQGVPTVEPEPELSYVEQYLKDHPDSHLDKNGWVQNADGSYAKDENGQLFGNEERVFRNLRENETLDKAGNIVEQPQLEPKWVFGEQANQGKEISVEEAYFEELAKKTDDLKNLVMASGGEVTPEAADAMLGEMEKVVVENPSFEPEYEQMKADTEVLKQQSASIEMPEESLNYHPADNVVDEPTPAYEPEVQTRSATPAREPEPEIVRTPLTVRSPEELAKIDALQEKANQAHDFNSLPEHWQKELIEIKAKGIVAQEQGDTSAYEAYKKEFDTKFRNYVDKDRELDRIAKQANIKGTREFEQRQRQEEMLASHGTSLGGKEWTQEEWEAKYKAFTEKYGEDMGTDKNGVRQYVRYSGGFKEEVPDVPERNFAELGYQQQKDGTWILKNRFTTEVVTDVNHNGIPDAGDTYEQVTEIGKPGSSFYSKEHSNGQYIEPIKEQINPSRNAQTELEKALARERARVSEQTASVLIPQFEPGNEK